MKKKDNSQEIMISNEFSSKLVIDVEGLRDNYRKIVEFVHPATVSVVVKANAYGLGLQKIAEELFSIGCKSFFVAFEQYPMKERPWVDYFSNFYLSLSFFPFFEAFEISLSN